MNKKSGKIKGGRIKYQQALNQITKYKANAPKIEVIRQKMGEGG